jgi:hypothetical protein
MIAPIQLAFMKNIMDDDIFLLLRPGFYPATLAPLPTKYAIASASIRARRNGTAPLPLEVSIY